MFASAGDDLYVAWQIPADLSRELIDRAQAFDPDEVRFDPVIILTVAVTAASTASALVTIVTQGRDALRRAAGVLFSRARAESSLGPCSVQVKWEGGELSFQVDSARSPKDVADVLVRALETSQR